MLDFTDEVLNRMKESLSDNNAFATAFPFLFFLFSVCTRNKKTLLKRILAMLEDKNNSKVLCGINFLSRITKNSDVEILVYSKTMQGTIF